MAAPTNRPLGVAIAGLGFGEAVHLPALRDCPGTEPVALWHPRAERLERACRAAELGGSTDFSAVLADPRVEAVVIATPPAPRFELARQALEAGKHLLLEKPVALEAAAIEELQRLAIRNKLCVAVDFEYRAVPVFQQLAALLAEGVLGEPWLVKLDWLMASRADASRPWTWYSQAAEGGGVLGALGTHAFDILNWLVGPAELHAARLSTAIRERPLAGAEAAEGFDEIDDLFGGGGRAGAAGSSSTAVRPPWCSGQPTRPIMCTVFNWRSPDQASPCDRYPPIPLWPSDAPGRMAGSRQCAG